MGLEALHYEYGGWNYRGFDIGNHFCEYAGFDYTKFAEVYPNKETQMQFLSAYAKEEMKLQASVDSEPGSPEFFDKLERLYVEVNRYALGSHLFWANQAKSFFGQFQDASHIYARTKFYF